MLKALSFSLYLSLALVLYSSCSDKCDECPDDYKLRFNFRNADKEQIFKDINLVSVTDLSNNPLTVSAEINDGDSLFLLSLDEVTKEELPDTIVFSYNNQVIDQGAINYGYQQDNDECCNNPRIIDGVSMVDLQAVRLIKREFDVYSIIVE